VRAAVISPGMTDSLTPGGELAGFVQAHDRDRFLCTIFAPPERRGALFALTAYNHELARAREAAANPVAALIRLQWWRETVEEAVAGLPPRRHEVAGPLHAAVSAGLLDPSLLLELADAREIEAQEDGIAAEPEFVAWLRGTAGGWSAVAGATLGAGAAEREVLRALGAAYGLAGVLRSVQVHAAQGRCLLPRDRLAEAGLDAAAVIADPRSATLRRVLQEMAQEGTEALAGARRDVPRSVIAAALPAVLARRDLARLSQREMPPHRGLADRLAVMRAGLLGRI
jgi:phytoene synthase